MLTRLCSTFAVILACLAPQARAIDVNSTTDVSLLVVTSCQITSTENLNFGNYDPLGIHEKLPGHSTGSISVVCTRGASGVKVALSQGSYASSGSGCASPARNMNGPNAARLGYMIYQDPSHSLPWGCDPESSITLPVFDGTLRPVSVFTYGVLPPNQDARMGEYRDTVEVFVSF